MFKQSTIFFLFAILPLAVFSQFSTHRFQKLQLKSDTIILDSLSIVPESIQILYNKTDTLPKNFYTIVLNKKMLLFNRKKMKSDSLLIHYKVFPYNFEKEYFHKNYKDLRQDMSLPSNPFTINYNATGNDYTAFYPSDGLTKNGSVSRGISFGNNQDVVVNSNMNLQVSGKLTKDIDLVLAATDNNIPVQPDGNTQQLQEFDKVYIQLNDENSKLIVGDFQLSKPPVYFMNFYKRAQGLLLTNNYTLEPLQKESPTLKSTFSGAVSRGRFARNVIQGIENNQGPYRLKGADNELFIIVLSGTEKIYIDGKLLQRGQENDYTIDYNSSEISFTAKQLITKDRRIVVEFQYAERNYARSLYFIGEEYKNEKLKLNFNFFSEQDNKNKTLQQSLTTQEKLKLIQIGDTLSSAVTNGATIAEFNTTEVFYKKMDTLAASGSYKIYKYSTNPDTAYRVKFSYVGEGKGNYKQIQNAANGKVFAWFEPKAGARQGNYEPVILLVTPKKKQMASFGGEYTFNDNHLLAIEGAYTTNDLNTFSSTDSRDDYGTGIKLNYNGKSKFKAHDPDSLKAGKKTLVLNYSSGYEFVHKNFSPIERFRSVEFTRDWNRNNDSIKNDQHIYNAGVGLEKPTLFKSNYSINGFQEGNKYKGYRNVWNNSFTTKLISALYNSSLLTSANENKQTFFYRHKSRYSQKIDKLVLTYLDEFENNKFNFVNKDSLLSNSYQFWEWEGNISNADTSGNTLKLFYRERTDKKAFHNYLKKTANAQSIGLTADVNQLHNHPFRTTITYRRLNIIDSTLINIKPDNTLLSRIEYSPRFWKGFIQSTLFYETGYGLEPKKEYSYIQVAAGQGQYTWKDYNNNGIKELDEFEIAQYTDQAVYIKVYTPTNNYVKAGHNQFSGNIFLRPAVFKTDKNTKFFQFLCRFVTQTAYRIDKKTVGNKNNNLDPFRVESIGNDLLYTNYNLRQALFFNQNSSIAGFDYTYQENMSKQLLTNGFETRNLKTHELRIRWNINRSWALFSNNTAGLKNNLSQYFNARNYSIRYYEIEPKISFQPNTAFRINAIYKHSEKKNIAEGGFQQAILDDYALEMKYNKLAKGSFNLRSDFILITYNDVENSPIAFEMLNALKTGQNFTWNLSYQYNLTANMQISINYDGRKPPHSAIIHIGGAQVRAFF